MAEETKGNEESVVAVSLAPHTGVCQREILIDLASRSDGLDRQRQRRVFVRIVEYTDLYRRCLHARNYQVAHCHATRRHAARNMARLSTHGTYYRDCAHFLILEYGDGFDASQQSRVDLMSLDAYRCERRRLLSLHEYMSNYPRITSVHEGKPNCLISFCIYMCSAVCFLNNIVVYWHSYHL
jgi:hypothetical protein